MLGNFGIKGLFWKLVIPVIVLFTITIIGLSYYIPQQIKNRAVEGATSASEQTAIQFKVLRKYYVENVLKKVKAGSNMKPAINHKNDPNAFPLPATMIHELSELLKDEGTSVNLYSKFPFPNRKSRVLDSFQSDAWDFLVKNPKSIFVKETHKEGKYTVRTAVADTMVADACVNCHNSHPDTPRTGWKLGDVRGVLEIKSDISKLVASSAATGTNIVLLLVGVLLSVLAAIYYVFKNLISNKLAVLDNSIAELAAGSSDLTRRLDESGNDEISNLACGFNKFLANHRIFIKEIAGAAQQLSDSTNNMVNVTSQAKEDASEQKNQIEMVATAISEMSASVQEVARNTASADESAHQAKEETLSVVTL